MLLGSAASAVFALALPAILLMYLLKRRYPETEIASHLLWRRALREQEANRPWQRLRRCRAKRPPSCWPSGRRR